MLRFGRAFSSSSLRAGRTLPSADQPFGATHGTQCRLVLRSRTTRALGKGTGDPFDKIVACNIGNPQEVGQMPISFPRQVLALTSCPELLNEPAVVAAMPQDVVERAQKYLSEIPAGTGAYSHSKGVEVVRREVADFIAERDGGHEANPEHIFLTDGASAVQMGLQALVRTSGYYDSNTTVPIILGSDRA